MDFDLNKDQQAFRETAGQFANNSLAPFAAQWDTTHHFPKDVLKKAGDLGFMAIYSPTESGGMGLGRLDAAIIFEELAQGCTSTTAFMTIHNMALNMIARYGSDAVKAQWCPALAGGDKLASYCLTEPGAGSDASSLRTYAKQDGSDYLITGSKSFISGAGDTDVLLVMARTGQQGPNGISTFVIPADLPGIEYGKKEDKMGWNSQPTRTITFDKVRIPKENLLAEEGHGFKLAMEGLDGGRINIAACSIGTAKAALDTTLDYTQQRTQFNQAISEFQASQFKLADMLTELVAARQMVRLAAVKLDQNDSQKSTYCAMAKRFATDAGFRICNEALQLHGGYGYIKDYPLERYVRDTRVHQILEGTNEIMRVIIARKLLIENAMEVLQ